MKGKTKQCNFKKWATIYLIVFGLLLTSCNLAKAPHVSALNDFKSKTTIDTITWGNFTIQDLKNEIERNEVLFPAAIKFLKYSGVFFVMDSETNSELIKELKESSHTSLKLENFSKIIKNPKSFKSELFLFSNKLNLPEQLITRPSECLKEFNNSSELTTYVLKVKEGNFIENKYLNSINEKMNTDIKGIFFATGFFLMENEEVILWTIVW